MNKNDFIIEEKHHEFHNKQIWIDVWKSNGTIFTKDEVDFVKGWYKPENFVGCCGLYTPNIGFSEYHNCTRLFFTIIENK